MADDYHRLPIRYPARFDYGSRRGYPTRAVVYHMAEGTGVARYLSTGSIARGVSVHYTVESGNGFRDGEIVRILAEDRISGSIDPDTIRRTDDPNRFYGVRHNRHALGKWWDNPNVAVISVEVAGRAKDGPSAKQIRAMVRLFEDVDRRYGRVIPLGHRDFQQVKPCPGQGAAIRRAFREMGGHGRDFDASAPGRRYVSTRGFRPGTVCDVQPGARLVNYPDGKRIGGAADPGTGRPLLGYSPGDREWALIHEPELGPGRTAWVKAARIANVRTAEPATGDCDQWEAAHAESIEWHQDRRAEGP